MDDAARLDEIYHVIISVFVERGQAPHYTEIASRLGISVEEGKRRLHELMATRLPNWLFPETDLIASFAPFNNLPTQYRGEPLSVDVRDGVINRADPSDIVFYVDLPIKKWYGNLPFA